jgi:hypothetical protein
MRNPKTPNMSTVMETAKTFAFAFIFISVKRFHLTPFVLFEKRTCQYVVSKE